MSVYTTVSESELTEFLSLFPAGQLVSYQGIAAGIENTNYFVTTDVGEYVLTLFEHHTHDELPFFINLMAWLAEHEIPSAHPIADHAGKYLHTLHGKPAVLVVRLHGNSPKTPNREQCHALGEMLGRLHLSGASYPDKRLNPRGKDWRFETGKKLLQELNAEDASLLQAELVYQADHDLSVLPQGIIHADLFRDNSLFEDNKVTGLIDFYYACNDALVYDLAISVNDWCSLEDGTQDTALFQSMMQGYTSVRTLSRQENEHWLTALRAAALRFWLSRLCDMHFPREGEMTHTKNPDEYRRILENHIQVCTIKC